MLSILKGKLSLLQKKLIKTLKMYNNIKNGEENVSFVEEYISEILFLIGCYEKWKMKKKETHIPWKMEIAECLEGSRHSGLHYCRVLWTVKNQYIWLSETTHTFAIFNTITANKR